MLMQIKGGYLETTGHGLTKVGTSLAQAYVERLSEIHSSKVGNSAESKNTIKTDTLEENSLGMKLIASTSRMHFANPVSQISTSIMTIHNCGTVAMHFEWVPSTKPNPLKV
jgi:hypothetical protein